MSAYEALAASYDRLTNDVDYKKTLQYLQRLFAHLGVQPESVLDLACGTGSLSVLLAEQGYSVLGADISPDMLAEAYEKAAAFEGDARPFFICQPMQELELPYEVDAVVCCLDSMNYLTEPEDCRETMRRVCDSLAEGGVFVFDINSPYKLERLDGEVFLDEDDDVYCVWRAEYDPESRICLYGMDLFQREGSLWQRSREEHAEYAYTPAELTAWLGEAGFTDVRTFADASLEAPAPEELRIYFTARKETKHG